MSETLRLMAAAAVAGLVAFPAAAQVPAHEQAWLDRWNVTPQMRYDTPRLLDSSRIASRLDEAERAAREGDQVAYVLVALEHNRRCKGGRRIVREACAAYAAWRGEWGALHRTEVSPALRSFHMLDNRRDGLRLRALEAGQIFDLGVGGPAEPAPAQLFYQLALLSDDAAEQAEANYRLGRMHEDGRLGADLSQARRLETIRTHYSRAAEAGHPMAAYVMAHISLAEAGDGGPAHLKTWAAGYFRDAANGGIADAAWRYARMLETGEVQEARGPETLLRYYRMGAERGHVPSMAGVARAYYQGWGVREDERQAEEWWKRAAEAGDPEAAWIVANRMARRNDFSGGLPYLRRAAEGGYPGAQAQLQQWTSRGVRERSLSNTLLGVLEFIGDVGAAYERQRQEEVAVQEARTIDYLAALHDYGPSSAGSGGLHLTVEDTSDPDFDARMRANAERSRAGWAEYEANQAARWERFRSERAAAREAAANIVSESCRENCRASAQ